MTPCLRWGLQIIRRYHIQNRDDYKKYNKICGIVTKLVSVIKRLDARDPVRIELTDQILDKWARSSRSLPFALCPFRALLVPLRTHAPSPGNSWSALHLLHGVLCRTLRSMQG